MKVKAKKMRSLAPRQLAESVEVMTSSMPASPAPPIPLSPVPPAWLTENYTGGGAFIILEDKNGILRVRGEFARPDVPTANQRIYGLDLWRREIERVRPLLQQRKVVGELDHPDDGKLRLQRASHLLTDLRIEMRGGIPIVVGEAEILENTDQGRQLAALIRHRVQVGVSSRGQGSVISDGRGRDIVQNDFRLVTFDFVADPADIYAYPEVIGGPNMAIESRSDIEKIQSVIGADVGQVGALLFEGAALPYIPGTIYEDETSDSMVSEAIDAPSKSKELEEALTKARALLQDDVRKVVSEEVRRMSRDLNDNGSVVAAYIQEAAPHSEPSSLNSGAAMATAHTISEQPQLHELQELKARVLKLEEENTKLSNAAREMTYRYFLESKISDHPFSDEIKERVGDLSQYGSIQDVSEAIASSEAMLQEAYEEHLAEEKAHHRMVQRLQESQTFLMEENTKLRDALEKTVLAANKLGVQLYVEHKISRHPRASQIREVIREASPETRESADRIIEQFRIEPRSRMQIQEAIQNVRSVMGTPDVVRNLTHLEEGRSASQQGKNFNNLGVDLADLKSRMPLGDRRF